MKQTNYQLVDFLDFSPDFNGEDILWRACEPTGISSDREDIIITVPFQKQKCRNGIYPESDAKRKDYKLRFRAYNDKILRISVGFNLPEMPDSLMLAMSPALTVNPLNFKKTEGEWIIADKNGEKKAVVNFQKPASDHWSDLISKPEETFDIIFYPDGEKEIKISAYDQFFPMHHDALALAYVEKNGNPDRATISFQADSDEVFAGTGERFAKMDLSGRTVQLKNQDGLGVNSRRTYKNVPFYLSSRMYGMFLHSSAYGKFSLADHSTRSVQILSEQPLLDIFLIGGKTVEEIIYRYRQLTGFPGMPPLWSFGVWMSRMTYFSADEVIETCNRLRREEFPCDVIHLDTGWFRTDWLCEWKFSPERFPDPKKFIADLKNDGFRVSLWQTPSLAEKAEQYAEAKADNYIRPGNNAEKQGGSNFSASTHAGSIDFTYPKAVEWYKKLLQNLLEMGVACIKTDFGEEIYMGADYHAMKPELLNNLYALLYQKAAFEITREITGNGIIWARAGWAGCQRYPVHWGGDAACSWDGMAGSLKGGLHLGLSGFGFWSHDIPGFHGVPDFMNSVVPDDLYVRWTQFGVFSSHMRYHGASKREPYHYPKIADIVRRWWNLRYSLIPYLVEQSKKVTETGYPVLRALVFHHAHDKVCWHIHDQYYFGDDILVAPVLNSENKRDVYLPEGKWINFFTGKIYKGKQWLNGYEAPLDQMPVWVKWGAKIPVYPEKVRCTDELDLKKTRILAFDDTFKGIEKSIIGRIL